MNQQKDVVSRWGVWPVLSIQQPWAWLILFGGKDVENRSWPTKYRGKFYIHASRKFDHESYDDIIDLKSIYLSPEMSFPKPPQFPRGGIVGIVELVDCIRKAESKWADSNSWNFILKNAQEIDFCPLRGELGFFNLNG